jgi:AraC-like DNA-binding protein
LKRSNANGAVTLGELARAVGRDRWQLWRDFRAAFGTSPYRDRLLRRLDRARALLIAGHPIADAAATCGFADHSHFTRRTKRRSGCPRTPAARHSRRPARPRSSLA